MRGWLGLALVVVLFSGCIGAGDVPVPEDDPGPYAHWERAYEGLVDRYPQTEGFELHAIVGHEPMDVEHREKERKSSPDQKFLAGGNDEARLDGQANAWLYLFRSAEGTGWATVLLVDERPRGWGVMSAGLTLPSYDHFGGGVPLVEPTVGPVAAARVVRENGLLDGLVDDARWDFVMLLQQWTGNDEPVWVFEAKSRDNGTRRAVAVNAVSGAQMPVADEAVAKVFEVPEFLGLPTETRSVTFDVGNVGFDRMSVEIEDQGFVLYDPSGKERWPYVSDPAAGTWRVVLEGPHLVMESAVDVRVCAAEEPEFREGALPGPCDQ